MARECKSKMRIVRALQSLMETTPIDRIQVKRLCEEADVGRTTFYDNFENVFSVATWYWDRVVAETLGRVGTECSALEAQISLFSRLSEERGFFVPAFRDHNRSINLHGHTAIGNMYFDLVEEHLGRPVNDVERMAISFYNFGASDYCAEWISSGMHEDPILLAHIFVDAFPDVMEFLKEDPHLRDSVSSAKRSAAEPAGHADASHHASMSS